MKELLIRELETKEIEILLIEDGIVVERYINNDENNRIEGNIYIGKVQNVLPGMQAAFVNIGKGKNTFIHLKDILPKQDVTDKNSNIDVMVRVSKVVKKCSDGNEKRIYFTVSFHVGKTKSTGWY